MSTNIEFEEYSVNVKNAIKTTAIQFLHEVGGELRSQIQRNSRRKTSQTAGSYDYKVDESALGVYIGSNNENAIWEEFGTGIHALHGDGRKGWWVYVTGSPRRSSTKGKSYASPVQAKMAVALLREKGLDAHMTQGKTAHRPMFQAFQSTKSSIIRRAESMFSKEMK